MFFLFDSIPLEDVIHETIMPMLDYESRIALNRCFLPNERYITRFSKNEIICHELCIISDFLKYKLDKIENVTGQTRKLRVKKKSQLMIKLLHCFEQGNRSLLIMNYYPNFHKIVVRKLTNLSNPNSNELSHASRYFRQKINDHARRLLPHIQNIVHTSAPMQNILKSIKVKGF